MKASEIIEKLNLEPLPGEGGFFLRTYCNDLPQLAATQYGIDSEGTRASCTAIYYLVVPESFSALHRVKSDEMFHFYGGDPVEMIQIDESGQSQKFILGNRIDLGHQPQVLVRRGVWQGLKLLNEQGAWALMGTTVSPGFEYEDFELADRVALIEKYPALKSEILKFTRENGGQ